MTGKYPVQLTEKSIGSNVKNQDNVNKNNIQLWEKSEGKEKKEKINFKPLGMKMSIYFGPSLF